MNNIPQHSWDDIDALRHRPQYNPSAAVSIRHKLREKVVDRRTAWLLATGGFAVSDRPIVPPAQHPEDET
jgi:hypothetical protein